MSNTPLLRPKTREALEKGIRLGVPPFAVGASIGILPKTIGAWVAVGMRCLDETPEKPERPEEQVEFPGERFIAAGDWYRHELECVKLVHIITRVEGLLVGKLVKRMWSASKGNADMMKFLFKQYTHVHGITEPKQGASVEIKSGGENNAQGDGNSVGGITVYLPHNGREELPDILKPAEKRKPPGKPVPKKTVRK